MCDEAVVGVLQQRHCMGSRDPNRVRAASIGAGEAARVAAMHAAITQGMTPKQAYNSMSEDPHSRLILVLHAHAGKIRISSKERL